MEIPRDDSADTSATGAVATLTLACGCAPVIAFLMGQIPDAEVAAFLRSYSACPHGGDLARVEWHSVVPVWRVAVAAVIVRVGIGLLRWATAG